MARDPVCGVEVDENHAPATSQYRGVTYWFDSFACKHAFDKDPKHYVEHPAPPTERRAEPGTA